MKEGSRVKRAGWKFFGDHPERGVCTRVAVVTGPFGSEAMAHVRWDGDRRSYGLPARLVEVVP